MIGFRFDPKGDPSKMFLRKDFIFPIGLYSTLFPIEISVELFFPIGTL